jgi:hypothetical protein
MRPSLGDRSGVGIGRGTMGSPVCEAPTSCMMSSAMGSNLAGAAAGAVAGASTSCRMHEQLGVLSDMYMGEADSGQLCSQEFLEHQKCLSPVIVEAPKDALACMIHTWLAMAVSMGSGAEMQLRSVASGDRGAVCVGSAGMDARPMSPPQWRFSGAERDSRRERRVLPPAADVPVGSAVSRGAAR